MHGSTRSPKNMVLFDANMILRYLLNDNEEMATQAETYLNAEDVFVTIEVIAEVVYVLKGVYSMDRKQISDVVKEFLSLVKSKDADVLYVALETYGTKNLDFVDCVLYGYNQVKGLKIATFDAKLNKLLQEKQERS